MAREALPCHDRGLSRDQRRDVRNRKLKNEQIQKSQNLKIVKIQNREAKKFARPITIDRSILE
jgi:hypothetical protein